MSACVWPVGAMVPYATSAVEDETQVRAGPQLGYYSCASNAALMMPLRRQTRTQNGAELRTASFRTPPYGEGVLRDAEAALKHSSSEVYRSSQNHWQPVDFERHHYRNSPCITNVARDAIG